MGYNMFFLWGGKYFYYWSEYRNIQIETISRRVVATILE